MARAKTLYGSGRPKSLRGSAISGSYWHFGGGTSRRGRGKRGERKIILQKKKGVKDV